VTKKVVSVSLCCVFIAPLVGQRYRGKCQVTIYLKKRCDTILQKSDAIRYCISNYSPVGCREGGTAVFSLSSSFGWWVGG
jgi:hypothetical protein